MTDSHAWATAFPRAFTIERAVCRVSVSRTSRQADVRLLHVRGEDAAIGSDRSGRKDIPRIGSTRRSQRTADSSHGARLCLSCGSGVIVACSG